MVAQTDRQNIRPWVISWRNKAKTSAIVGSVGGFLLSIVFAALSYVAFNFLLFFFGGLFALSREFQKILLIVWLPFLFIGNALIPRHWLTVSSDSDTPAGGASSLLNPRVMIGIWKIMFDVFFCAPRMTIWSIRQFQRLKTLRDFDVEACSSVMAVLLSSEGKVPYQDILRQVQNVEPVKTFNQLSTIDGVLFLENEPPGISLSTSLRETLSSSAAESQRR